MKHYRFLSLGFFKSYGVHMRPYLLFVSGVAGAAGLATAIEHSYTETAWILAFICFFLGYGFGQALTDCSQIDTDSISSPYRPLTQGIVRARDVAALSILGLGGILVGLAWLNPWNILFGFLSVLGLATYTYFKKNYWFAGPLYNGWIVMLLPLMGFLCFKTFSDLSRTHFYLFTLTLLSYANFVLMGYLKDISADRQTGYQTFSVIFGWNATTWMGDIFALGSSILTGLILSHQNAALISWFFAAVGTVIALVGQGYAHGTKNQTESNSHFSIAATVRSFILWHLAVIVGFQPNTIFLALLFYATFEFTLSTRPERHQI